MNFSVDDIKALIIKHYQYFLVGILFICLVIILAIFSNKSRRDDKSDKTEQTAVSENEAGLEVPDVPLEVDAHENVNQLVNQYFTAMASGDTATLTSICSQLDEKEQIRIEKKAEYTENYEGFICYTKPGPESNSYIVFAYYEIKFKNIETRAPGLTSLYVMSNPDGSLYVYDGELSAEVSEYIRQIAAQDDVVQLLNQIDTKYSEAADADETLKNFMEALPTALDDAVSAELAARESATQTPSEDEVPAEETQSDSFEAKVKETVNVRKSPSTEGDKLGQIIGGDTITILEKLDNGWSKFDFQGQEAYVKTEFLDLGGAEMEGVETENTDNGGNSSSQTVTVNDTVNVRKGPSTDTDKLGSAQNGDKYKLISKEGEWVKIDYKGQEAYIKGEFVTVNN